MSRRGAIVYAFAPELDLWIKRFARPETPPVSVPDEAPGTSADPFGIAAPPLPHKPASGQSPAPHIPEQARALYLEGIYLWQKRSAAALSSAADRLVHAVELAPDFSAAHAELAVVYDLMVDYGALAEDIGYRLASQSAHRALQLEEGNARAHCVLADIGFYGKRDFAGSLPLYQAATRLDPADPLCHHWLAAALSLLDQQNEARGAILKARELYPTSRQVIYTEAMNLLGQREFEQARHLLRDLVAYEPEFANAYRFLAFAELGLGRLAEYLEVWAHCLRLKGDTASLAMLESARRAYVPGQAAAALARNMLSGQSPEADPYLVAHATALGEDWQGAADLLGKVPDCTAFYNVVDPAFSGARLQEGFRESLRRAQLPG